MTFAGTVNDTDVGDIVDGDSDVIEPLEDDAVGTVVLPVFGLEEFMLDIVDDSKKVVEIIDDFVEGVIDTGIEDTDGVVYEADIHVTLTHDAKRHSFRSNCKV